MLLEEILSGRSPGLVKLSNSRFNVVHKNASTHFCCQQWQRLPKMRYALPKGNTVLPRNTLDLMRDFAIKKRRFGMTRRRVRFGAETVNFKLIHYL